MIEVERLTKSYGSFEAVKDVSFSVGRAEVLGFLGPNGAGKTTIIKTLTGCHFPSSGQVTIDGICAREDPAAIKSRIGYLPESVPLYGDMSPREYLHFAAAARLIPRGLRQKAVDGALAACGLEGPAGSQRVDSLSKGYRQRAGLAQAIVHDPPILILDEPTSGLDPNQIIEIRNLIRELGKRKTVIFSTHILQEVEAVCSRVLILNEGRIAAQGTPGEIAGTLKRSKQDTWELLLKGPQAADIAQRLAGLSLPSGAAISGISAENVEPGTVRLCFTVTGGGDSGGEWIFDWAVSGGCKIISMNHKKLSLEDIFVGLTS
ncbi:MAG: ATP-binding cassette domain-containing protein [Treponema sp.]|nr:ATP-binding cassette domain-containing protein [Treponema sp.]